MPQKSVDVARRRPRRHARPDPLDDRREALGLRRRADGALRAAAAARGSASAAACSAGPTTSRSDHVDIALAHPIKLIANALGSPPKDVDRPRARARREGGGARGQGACTRNATSTTASTSSSRRATRPAATPARSRRWCSCPRWSTRSRPRRCSPPAASAAAARSRRRSRSARRACGPVRSGSPPPRANSSPAVLEAYLEATSSDTVRSRSLHRQAGADAAQRVDRRVGGPRRPRSARHAAAEHPHVEANARIARSGRKDLVFAPVGQIVGRMNEVRAGARRDVPASSRSTSRSPSASARASATASDPSPPLPRFGACRTSHSRAAQRQKGGGAVAGRVAGGRPHRGDRRWVHGQAPRGPGRDGDQGGACGRRSAAPVVGGHAGRAGRRCRTAVLLPARADRVDRRRRRHRGRACRARRDRRRARRRRIGRDRRPGRGGGTGGDHLVVRGSTVRSRACPATSSRCRRGAASCRGAARPTTPPLQMGIGHGLWATGAMAALGALAAHAWHAAHRSRATDVEVTALEVMAVCLNNYPPLYCQFTGNVVDDVPRRRLAPDRALQGRLDRAVRVHAQQWADFAGMIGRDELAGDDRLNSMGGGPQPRARAVGGAARGSSSTPPRRSTSSVGCSGCRSRSSATARDVLDMSHFVERGVFVEQPGRASASRGRRSACARLGARRAAPEAAPTTTSRAGGALPIDPAAATPGRAPARRRARRRPHRVLGRPRGHPPARHARRRRGQGRVAQAARRHALRHHPRRRPRPTGWSTAPRSTGPTPASARSPSTSRCPRAASWCCAWSSRPTCVVENFTPRVLANVGLDDDDAAGPATRPRAAAHARVRARRPLARPQRLRPDHGAGVGHRVAHAARPRSTRRCAPPSTPSPASTARSRCSPRSTTGGARARAQLHRAADGRGRAQRRRRADRHVVGERHACWSARATGARTAHRRARTRVRATTSGSRDGRLRRRVAPLVEVLGYPGVGDVPAARDRRRAPRPPRRRRPRARAVVRDPRPRRRRHRARRRGRARRRRCGTRTASTSCPSWPSAGSPSRSSIRSSAPSVIPAPGCGRRASTCATGRTPPPSASTPRRCCASVLGLERRGDRRARGTRGDRTGVTRRR